MLRAIQQFFDQKILQPKEDPAGTEKALHLATAALFIEVVRSDFEVKKTERQAVEGSLNRLFDLSPEETGELVRLAEEKADDSVSLYEFTQLIHQSFSPEEKVHVMELLWGIAFADGHLDHHEEHLMRKIQGLLHIPHKDFIGAKLRARGS